MIGAALILMGFGLIYLSISQLRDYRSGRNDFAPIDDSELDVWWKRAVKIGLFNSYLDIWIFGVAGLFAVALGLVAVLR